MKTDEELKKITKVSLGKDNIINIVFMPQEKPPSKKEQLRMVELFEKTTLGIFREHPLQKYNVLVDISYPAKDFSVLTEVRGSYAEIFTHKQIDKIACLGGDLLVKTIAKFIFVVARKKEKLKWFTDRKKAWAWLKEER